VKVNVKLFARAKDLAGAESVRLDLADSANVADVRRVLAERVPALSGIAPKLLVAIGNEYATDSAVICPGSEVACFPPVSGG
jgi:sulfur-carrier protein